MTDINSEFTCDPVVIRDIEVHPNATKLAVARLHSGAAVVVSIGDFKPGDTGIHVGPDSMVPVDSPVFSYLKQRLDYKPGNSHYRIRAAKIRGVQSDGILIPKDSDTKGVHKYVSPAEFRLQEAERTLETQQKKVSWFSRWFNPVLRSKKVIPDYKVVSLRKVQDFFAPGEAVEVTEKIHGSNIRFGWWNGRKYVGSHHTVKTDIRKWWEKPFTRISNNHYYKDNVWQKWVDGNVDWDELPDNHIFFGEIFGDGIQELTYGMTFQTVRIFDVWDVDMQEWLGFDAKTHAVWKAGLVSIPATVREFNLNFIKQDAEEGSYLSKGHIREGLVVKSLDGKKRGKWVSDNYRNSK